MPSILVPNETCFTIVETKSAGVLVDARDYFRAFHRAASEARQYILLAGWEFDSDVELVRGEDAQGSEYPAGFRALLTALSAERPELRIYILAWDYSVFFAMEREWMQKLIFDWTTPKAISFQFDRTHASGACHHQKLAIVDGRIAMLGGIDFASSRWDDRRHAPVNPDRRDGPVVHGPYHDAGCFLTGPAVQALRDVFEQRWAAATDERLDLPAEVADEPIVPQGAMPLRASSVGLSQTRGSRDGEAPLEQVLALYCRAIAGAERSIYMETQYFTSEAVRDALVARMRDSSKPRLDIVLVKPRGADTPKERVVLADAQDELLASLSTVAEETGSRVGIYYSASLDEGGKEVPTFVHAKLLVVDDRVLSVGSANLTNRSMKIDTELNATWEARGGDDELASDIAAVRQSLLAEHTGVEAGPFGSSEGLVERLDAIAAAPSSRLWKHAAKLAPNGERVIRLERIFDPDKPLEEVALLEALQLPGGARATG